MKLNIVAASALAVFIFSGSAYAASITNLDSNDYSFSVIEGDKETQFNIKSSQTVEGFCLQGCVVRMNSGEKEEYEFEAGDVVVIEEGQLYLEPNTPSQGDGSNEKVKPEEGKL